LEKFVTEDKKGTKWGNLKPFVWGSKNQMYYNEVFNIFVGR
jgi:hypothetical protein